MKTTQIILWVNLNLKGTLRTTKRRVGKPDSAKNKVYSFDYCLEVDYWSLIIHHWSFSLYNSSNCGGAFAAIMANILHSPPMCGIAGFIDYKKESSPEILKAMSDALIHRGPDDSGYEMFDTPTASVGFGFRRLSIIELSALGHQPMHFAEAGLAIIFNGEVYNFRELRKELEASGYTFKSDSDTEVVLKSYAKWGAKCVERFIGMFAIAIYDKPNQKVILFRDRVGVKPLFYYHKNGLFLFGSELKALHQHPRFKKQLNFGTISQYFQSSITAPNSIFENTFKVFQAHYLEIDLKTAAVTQTKYWDVVDYYNKPKLDISYEDAKKHLVALMQSAFDYRMIADVPVGIFLSGGYDSTAVAALLQHNRTQKIKTFTIAFDEKGFNEAPYAKQVAEHLGTDHYERICSYDEVFKLIDTQPYVFDEPDGGVSCIPIMLLSRIAREHVTVALSADGGDEIFGGYQKFADHSKFIKELNEMPEMMQKLIAKTFPECLLRTHITTANERQKKLTYYKYRDDMQRYRTRYSSTSFRQTQALLLQSPAFLDSYYNHGDAFNKDVSVTAKAMATEYKTYLHDVIVQKIDRASMSVSLEGREPFLDQRIIEFTAQLPDEYKIKNGSLKHILKDIVHDYVPKEIMERPKMGFGAPVHKWMKHKELKTMFADLTSESYLKKQQVFNVNAVGKIRDAFLADQWQNSARLTNLFMFQLWYQRWMQ